MNVAISYRTRSSACGVVMRRKPRGRCTVELKSKRAVMVQGVSGVYAVHRYGNLRIRYRASQVSISFPRTPFRVACTSFVNHLTGPAQETGCCYGPDGRWCPQGQRLRNRYKTALKAVAEAYP